MTHGESSGRPRTRTTPGNYKPSNRCGEQGSPPPPPPPSPCQHGHAQRLNHRGEPPALLRELRLRVPPSRLRGFFAQCTLIDAARGECSQGARPMDKWQILWVGALIVGIILFVVGFFFALAYRGE